jgi:enoyl-CoA hydratase
VPIHYELGDDHVAVITIDRPETRNALDLPHFHELAEAWRRFKDEEDAWVAIITGVGDAFCAGADLKSFIPQVTELQPARWRSWAACRCGTRPTRCCATSSSTSRSSPR